MPVLVKCSCGKQLRVPDEYVGRRVKCTVCGEIQTVTAPKNGHGVEPGKAPAKPAPEAGKAAVIRFKCEGCGRQMQARAEYAGRTTKCPGCAAALVVPGSESKAADKAPDNSPQSRIKAEKPAPKSKPPAPDYDDLEEIEEEEEAIEEEAEKSGPKKRKGKKGRKGKKSGRNLGLLIGLGVGALVLLSGGGVGLWLLLRGSGPSVSDMAFVPGDAQVIMVVQVAALWNTPVVQDLVRELPPNARNNLDEMEKETGLKPADLDRGILVVKDGNSNQAWFVLTTLKPIDRKKVLASNKDIDPTERKYQNHVYYASKNKPGCFHFVSDKMVLFASTENALKAALNQVAAPSKGGGRLANSLRLVDGRNQFVMGFVPPAELVNQGKQGLQGNQMLAGLVPLLELQSSSMTLNLVGGSLQMDVTVSFPADAQAKAAKTSLDNLKGQAALLLGFIQDAAQKADAQKTLNSLTIDQKGLDVVVKMSGDVNVKDIVKGMRAMGGPGGGPAPPAKRPLPKNP